MADFEQKPKAIALLLDGNGGSPKMPDFEQKPKAIYSLTI